MRQFLVRIGDHVFNIEAIANVKWKGDTLYIDFIGERFQSFTGEQAQAVWRALVAVAVDVQTGEVGIAK